MHKDEENPSNQCLLPKAFKGAAFKGASKTNFTGIENLETTWTDTETQGCAIFDTETWSETQGC